MWSRYINMQPGTVHLFILILSSEHLIMLDIVHLPISFFQMSILLCLRTQMWLIWALSSTQGRWFVIQRCLCFTPVVGKPIRTSLTPLANSHIKLMQGLVVMVNCLLWRPRTCIERCCFYTCFQKLYNLCMILSLDLNVS